MGRRNISGTKAERFLRWLQRHPEGKTFGECQRYIVEQIRGLNYDEREPITVNDKYIGKIVISARGPRIHRGVWCDHLLPVYNKPNIFRKFCESVVGPDGKKRYRVVKPIRPPFFYWSGEEKRERHMKVQHADGSSCNKYP
jgi:hypothetical protein